MKQHLLLYILVISTGMFCLSVQFVPCSPTPKDVSASIQEKIQESLWYLNQVTLSESTKEQQKSFTALRRNLRILEWTFPILGLQPGYHKINQAPYQLLERMDSTFSLQFMEWTLWSNNPDNSNNINTDSIHAFLQQLEKVAAHFTFSQADLLYGLGVDLNQQFLLSPKLYRFGTTEIYKEDLAAVLSNAQFLLQSAHLSKSQLQHLNQPFQTIESWLKTAPSSPFDYAHYYRSFLSPTLKQIFSIAKQAGQTPTWFKELPIRPVPAFAKQWLKEQNFSQIINDQFRTPKTQLGELLFYEPMLSGNNKRTCASCHKPQKAFTDGRQTSMGYDFSSKLSRNSPTLFNTIYNLRFSHDSSKKSLNEQISFVVNHPQEFRSSFDEIIQKLNSSSTYQILFQKAFPEAQAIDSIYISQALSYFMASLQSFDAPFDQYLRDERPDIASAAIEGFNLFMGKAGCVNCHIPPLYTSINPLHLTAQGISSHANQSNNYYKTPTLRNLQWTMPYMHHGLFNNLEEALTWIYSENDRYRQLLSENEKQHLKAFLDALNDEQTIQSFDENITLPKTDGSLAPMKRRSAGVY